MNRALIFLFPVLFLGCGQVEQRRSQTEQSHSGTEQMYLLDHPRSRQIQDDSDVVYILKHEYPAVYRDIIQDGCRRFEGRVTLVYDADFVSLEFPRGAATEEILAREIIIYRGNAFLAFATPAGLDGQRIRYRLTMKSAEVRPIQVGDQCMNRL